MKLVVQCAGGLLFDLHDFTMVKIVEAENDEGYMLVAMNPLLIDEVSGIKQQHAFAFFVNDNPRQRAEQAFRDICRAVESQTFFVDITVWSDQPTEETIKKLHLDAPEQQEQSSQPKTPPRPPVWFRFSLDEKITPALLKEMRQQLHGRRIVNIEAAGNIAALQAGD